MSITKSQLKQMIEEELEVIITEKAKSKSQHMKAKAADMVIKGMKSVEVHRIVTGLIKEGKLKKGGVGLYKYFVHYDVRGFNARWKGKGVKDYKP